MSVDTMIACNDAASLDRSTASTYRSAVNPMRVFHNGKTHFQRGPYAATCMMLMLQFYQVDPILLWD